MPRLAVRTLSGTIALFNKGENEMGGRRGVTFGLAQVCWTLFDPFSEGEGYL